MALLEFGCPLRVRVCQEFGFTLGSGIGVAVCVVTILTSYDGAGVVLYAS